MPQNDNPKTRPDIPIAPGERSPIPYAELHVTTNFSFLRGASHPEEMVLQAALSGCHALAVTDINSLAGIVRGKMAAKDAKLPYLVGCHLQLKSSTGPLAPGADAPALSLLVYPTDRPSYGRLCRLLTFGKRRAPKGQCHLTLQDLLDHQQGLLAIILPPPLSLPPVCHAQGRAPEHARQTAPSPPSAHSSAPALPPVCHAQGRAPEHARQTAPSPPSAHSSAPALPPVCHAQGRAPEHARQTAPSPPSAHSSAPALPPVCHAQGRAPEHARQTAPSPPPAHSSAPQTDFEQTLSLLRKTFDDDRLSLAASCLYDGHDKTRLAALADLSRKTQIPLVATNDIHYHAPERKPLQDVLTCIRLGCTLDQAGFALFANAERHIKGPDEMARLFADYPDAIARTMAIATRAAGFSLDQLKYEYPSEVCPPGISMMDYLRELTWKGAHDRYPNGISEKVRQRIEHEFQLIQDLNYPAYFLTVADIVTYARSIGILCQGRGAAANSTVCYCLGVTAVDPERIDLLVERFISKERDEPPDIDIDFEHERREEVIQYLYKKYGRERAALTAEVICYRRRSAVREVGKAMGLSLDCVDKLAKSGDWWDKGVITTDRLREIGLDGRDPVMRQTIDLAGQLIGFPRHLSQHVGGFVLTQGPLCESVPIENAAMPDRTIIEWDKDDIDELGMLKVDILGLGMLTAIRKSIDFVNDQTRFTHSSFEPSNLIRHSSFVIRHSPLQFHTVPPEDPAVYDMLCNADSVGVFQVESRAQMTMLPRLRPRQFYDLVIEVAIVRPGPIQGGMVHPYLRRRMGKEKLDYPNEKIREVLGKTLGVPLFQEQAMKMAIVAAGFTPGEADQLRRAMAAWKRKGDLILRFGRKIVAGMLANGYSRTFANQCFEQIQGFSAYGFPESHAASFALLVYVSAWLKCHHPAAFAAGLLNSQPMGFYQPAQIVRDAQNHGVNVRPVDVLHSHWDCTLEPTENGPALRLGMRLVGGLRETEANKITAAVQSHAPFTSLTALWRASGARAKTMHTLATADAFTSLGLDRQAALWMVTKLRDDLLPMFDSLDTLEPEELEAQLPKVAPVSSVVYDYASIGLSLKAHPISFSRNILTRHRVIPARDLSDPRLCPHGRRIAVAGLVLVRQRPGTASGIMFITLEDETGIANLVVRPQIYERWYRSIRHCVAMVAWGKVERQGQVVHLLVERADDLKHFSKAAPTKTLSRDFH